MKNRWGTNFQDLLATADQATYTNRTDTEEELEDNFPTYCL